MLAKLPLAKQLQLLRFGGLKSSDITPSILSEVSGILGLQVDATSDNVKLIADAMASGDASTLSDVLQKPDLFAEIASLLKPVEAKQDVERRCPICDTSFSVTIDNHAAEAGFAEANCPRCDAEFHVTPDGLVFAPAT